MTSVVLIPWANTDWSDAGRVATITPLALNSAGAERARRWANELARTEFAAIYRSDERTAIETAGLIAGGAEAPARCDPQLREVSLGLWEGLTEAQIEQRYPKLHKLWSDRPEIVCPPEGEELASAQERLEAGLARIARKNRNRAVGLVLGPLALAVVRCCLEGADLARVRGLMSTEPLWYQVDDRPGA